MYDGAKILMMHDLRLSFLVEEEHCDFVDGDGVGQQRSLGC